MTDSWPCSNDISLENGLGSVSPFSSHTLFLNGATRGPPQVQRGDGKGFLYGTEDGALFIYHKR